MLSGQAVSCQSGFPCHVVLLNKRVVSPSGQGSVNFHLMAMLSPEIDGGQKNW